jgi:hypothetical protein
MNKIFSVLISFVFILSQVSCQPQKPSEVKNIILLIGDGMGLAQVYAGMSVSKDKLNIERSQVVGLSKPIQHRITQPIRVQVLLLLPREQKLTTGLFQLIPAGIR